VRAALTREVLSRRSAGIAPVRDGVVPPPASASCSGGRRARAWVRGRACPRAAGAAPARGRGAPGAGAGPCAASAAPDGGAAEGAAPPSLGRPRALNPNADVEGAAAEARAAGRTLVVVAGHPLCGYCTRFETALAASGMPAREDIVLVRELNPWESNAAYRWTGGGNAPIIRVTRWDSSGGLVCDRKLNRPGVADLAAALDACLSPTQ